MRIVHTLMFENKQTSTLDAIDDKLRNHADINEGKRWVYQYGC